MKKIAITIVNTEEDCTLQYLGEGFTATLEGGVQRGNMAIEAYAFAVAQVVASIPAEEVPGFLVAFIDQVRSLAKNPKMRTPNIYSARKKTGLN